MLLYTKDFLYYQSMKNTLDYILNDWYKQLFNIKNHTKEPFKLTH